MADSNEKKTSWGTVKRIVKRKKRRQAHEDHHGLNIYPMMDMMTILLVFLVMQFALSTAAVVQESDELKIPYSTSKKAMSDALLVQVARNTITVKGQKVCDLREGVVDAGDKRGGSNAMLISPLARELKRAKEYHEKLARLNPELEFKGEVMLIVDERTPYRTLSEVIYTLGSNGYAELKFLTDKNVPKE